MDIAVRSFVGTAKAFREMTHREAIKVIRSSDYLNDPRPDMIPQDETECQKCGGEPTCHHVDENDAYWEAILAEKNETRHL